MMNIDTNALSSLLLLTEQIKNKVLELAIRGKLVKQDANDEPASVLLERIRDEKRKQLGKKYVDSYIYKGNDGRYYEVIGKNAPADITDELPFEVPENWIWAKIEDITYQIGNKSNQIQTKDILDEGMIPVVSQGQNLIDGYSDDVNKTLYIDGPVVVFGDHTRNVKFIDFDFIIGADGTKIFKPIVLNAHYLFYLLKYFASKIRDRGYARHYSLIKQLYLPLPPLAEQQRIVEKIEEIMSLINK